MPVIFLKCRNYTELSKWTKNSLKWGKMSKMYVCMYVYLGLRARQHLWSLAPVMKWWWMIMIFGDLVGLKLPDIRLTGEEKPHPGNMSRPGIEPGPAAWQARMLPLVSHRWTPYCVCVYIYIYTVYIGPFNRPQRLLKGCTYFTYSLFILFKNNIDNTS